MKDQSLRVLIVEDLEDDLLLIIHELKKGGYNPVYERVETAGAMKKALKEKQWDIILCDYKMPIFDGSSAIAILKEANINIPLIIVTGKIGEETAIECMRLGAQDYIMKDKMSRLCPAIARELEDAKVRNKQKQAEEALRESERKYRNLYHYAQVGLFETSMEEAKIIACNQYCCDLAGFPDVESAIGMDILQLYDNPNDREEVKKVLRTQGYTSNHLLQLKNRLTGEIFWVEFSARVNPSSSIIEGSLIDVTERKRAEDVLRISEERYRMAETIGHVGNWEYNLQNTKFWGSDEAKRIYGFDPEALDFSSDEVENCIPERDRVHQALVDLIDADKPYNLEFEIHPKNSLKPRIISSVAELKRDEHGNPLLVTGVIQDITDRKRAEEELKESENKYRLSFENVTDVIYTIDTDLTLLSLSPSVETILGYKPQDFIGRSVSDLGNILTPESFEQAIADISMILKGETISATIYRFIAKDGTIKYGEVSGSPLMREGKIIGIISVARDITERKRAAEVVAENERKFSTLIGNLPGMVYRCDNDREWTMSFLSEGCRDLTGYAPEEISGNRRLSYNDVINFEHRERIWNEVQTALSKREHFSFEYSITTAAGEVKWVWERGCGIFSPDGEVQALEGFISDITERNQVDEALRESEERYRIIAENTADTIAIFDLNLNPTYVSPSIIKLRGYTVQETMTQTLNQMLTPDSLERASKLFADQIALESSGTADPARTTLIELEEYCKDGSTIWVELAVSFLRDNNLKPTGILTVTRNITERKKSEEQLHQTLNRLKKAVGTTIQVLGTASEVRDPYTAGHQKRVADLARTIATEMGLAPDKIEGIRMAGSIHDIGKISIPAEILVKPTKLTNIEFSLIKEHSQIGYEMLKDVESPWPLAQIVYQHHERMNGSGYPRNLKGDEILLDARIMAVADVVEAMASHRPYRPGLGIEAALEEIEKNKGILYDDTVADTCLKLFREKGYQLK